MAGIVEQLLCRCLLDDPAQIHDGDTVGHMANHRQVVADQQKGHAVLALDVGQQIEDLAADGNVERGDRLIGDNQAGFRRQGTRDGDALALAAAELMWIAVDIDPGQSDRGDHLDDAPAPRRGVPDAVDGKRFGNDGANRQAGIQRLVRVLIDDLDPPAHRFQGPAVETGDVQPLEAHGAGVRLCHQGKQAGQRGLAAAALADHGQGLAGLDAKVDAIDRPQSSHATSEQGARADREILDEAAGLDERDAGHGATFRQATHRPAPALLRDGSRVLHMFSARGQRSE
jgi:hypothetical protein